MFYELPFFSSGTFWVILIGYMLAIGMLSANVAGSKGYNEISWFFVGIFFGIIGVIAAAGLHPKQVIRNEDQDEESEII